MLSILQKRLFDHILRKNRISIVSYPKSGRTWLRLILNDLNLYPDFTHASSNYLLQRKAAEVKDGMGEFYNKRIIFLVRDPRDTIVSNFFQVVKSDPGEGGDIKDFYQGTLKELIRDPVLGIEKIIAFNTAWRSERENFQDFMILRYEDMKKDPCAEILRVIDFMNIPFISLRQIQKAVDDNQFKKLQKREISGELYKKYGDRFSKGWHGNEDKLKVRKGKVGSYKDYFDPEDIKYCDDLIANYDYNL